VATAAWPCLASRDDPERHSEAWTGSQVPVASPTSVCRSLYGESGGSEGRHRRGQTHRGAERGHTPVSSTDGQVVEGNGLPVQLHVLADPQNPLHG
jgi:hypothetical protein